MHNRACVLLSALTSGQVEQALCVMDVWRDARRRKQAVHVPGFFGCGCTCLGLGLGIHVLSCTQGLSNPKEHLSQVFWIFFLCLRTCIQVLGLGRQVRAQVRSG